MKFKLDENLDVRAASVLEGAGHDVATVRSQRLGGTADAVLARIVRGEGRILVTLDRGFGTFVPTRPAHTRESSCSCSATKRARP